MLSSWVLVHSLHPAHLDGHHIFASLEIEEKSENLGEDNEDIDQCEQDNTLFLSQPNPGHNTYTYTSPYISSYKVPPKRVSMPFK